MLLVDKPKSWTSFDVVKKVRSALRVKKVGHAGTLDPMATGLLILCSSLLTKKIDAFQALGKVYEGSMRLGAVTASFDAETEATNPMPTDGIDEERIRKAVEGLTGNIEQLPPMYSAVKVEGQRLYKLARKGVEVERQPRPVTIERFDIQAASLPDLGFEIHCSKGTYVRTLAHDLGQLLGCGAYLTELRRTFIGNFSVAEAWSIEQIAEESKALGFFREKTQEPSGEGLSQS
ncbi:MAG: tRNA pseudouridine(55) synthase TruB [Bacteroidota bacterium]